MNEYQVHEGQTIADVSAHVYGTAAYAIDLALYNSISLSDLLTGGQMLKLPTLAINKYVIKALSVRGIIPATGHLKNNKQIIDYAFASEFAIQF